MIDDIFSISVTTPKSEDDSNIDCAIRMPVAICIDISGQNVKSNYLKKVMCFIKEIDKIDAQNKSVVIDYVVILFASDIKFCSDFAISKTFKGEFYLRNEEVDFEKPLKQSLERFVRKHNLNDFYKRPCTKPVLMVISNYNGDNYNQSAISRIKKLIKRDLADVYCFTIDGDESSIESLKTISKKTYQYKKGMLEQFLASNIPFEEYHQIEAICGKRLLSKYSDIKIIVHRRRRKREPVDDYFDIDI